MFWVTVCLAVYYAIVPSATVRIQSFSIGFDAFVLNMTYASNRGSKSGTSAGWSWNFLHTWE